MTTPSSLSRTFIFMVAIVFGTVPFLSASVPADVAETEIKKMSRFESSEISESSGVVVSRYWDGVLWTHNDSGDTPRIFGTNLKGETIMPFFMSTETYRGIEIYGAYNVDWEDIATDNEGFLYIAACGNNLNVRRDLAIYKVAEPDPNAAVVTRHEEIYRFEWPDQESFPPEKMNFDCEAIFWTDGHLYALSKHRDDTFTTCYRFDDLDPFRKNIPTVLGSFDVGAQVTGADISRDGLKLAVLTYQNIWIFEREEIGSASAPQKDWFSGRKYFLNTQKSNIRQCEGIAFDANDRLIVSNEQGDLLYIQLDLFSEVK